MTFFAACPGGAESFLAEELKNLGAESIDALFRGVRFKGSLETSYKAVLELRTASRLLLELFSGEARDENELYRLSLEYPWEKYFDISATFSCRVTGVPRSHDPRFATLRLKDAVADRFMKIHKRRPSVDKLHPDIRLEARWDGKLAVVYLNWGGAPLHERGYKLERGDATLKENSASLFLLQSGWAEIAASGGAFVDPVCGSGTFLAEAAMIAGGTAVGLNRKHWGFQRWNTHDERLWDLLRADAAVRRREGLDNLPPIVGFDKDPRAIDKARANLKRAGLDHKVQLFVHDMENGIPSQWPQGHLGLVAADPPYGRRMGSERSIEALYQALGRNFSKLPDGWHLALLSPNKRTADAAGLQFGEIHKVRSGGMDILLLVYHRSIGGSPGTVGSRTTAAGMSGTDDKQNEMKIRSQEVILDPKADSLKKQLLLNIAAMGKWAKKTGVSSYRIWDADLPEFNAAVDWYESRWLHVQEYSAPKSIPVEKTEMRLNTLVTILLELTDIPRKNLFLKTRFRGKRPYSKSRNDKQPSAERFIMRENGRRFFINLSDYLDVGIFLDHRTTRAIIRDSIKAGRFLNLFAYTGTATVMAAAGGARSTVTVDVSNTYLDWAKDNMALNGFKDSSAHLYVRSDAGEFLKKHSEYYDLIFLDPPTYSNGTGRDDWSVQEHHPHLIRLAAKRLAPHGVLLFSENFRGFQMDPGIKREFDVREITRQTIPPDFARRAKAHRCWEIRNPDKS